MCLVVVFLFIFWFEILALYSSVSTSASVVRGSNYNDTDSTSISIPPSMKKDTLHRERIYNYVDDMILLENIDDMIALENKIKIELEGRDCSQEGIECHYNNILYRNNENQPLHETLRNYVDTVYKDLVEEFEEDEEGKEEEKGKAFNGNENANANLHASNNYTKLNKKAKKRHCLLNRDSNTSFLHTSNVIIKGDGEPNSNISEFFYTNTIDGKDPHRLSEIYVECDFKFIFLIDGKMTSVYWRRGDDLPEIAKEIRQSYSLEKYTNFPDCNTIKMQLEQEKEQEQEQENYAPENSKSAFANCIDDHMVSRMTKVQSLEELRRRDKVLKQYERIFYEYLPLLNSFFVTELSEVSIDSLTVYDSEKNLVRIGSHEDGGYLLYPQEDDSYDLMISAGLGGNMDFENDFMNRYNTVCLGYDGDESTYRKTLDSVKSSKISVIKQFIGLGRSENKAKTETNLDRIIASHDNIFLKMDIEGYNIDMGEWPWLNHLTTNQLNKFRQMVIEFHFPSTPKHWNILEKITQTHYLIHFHANNKNDVMYRVGRNSKKVPAVFECTYIRKDLLKNHPRLNSTPLPREGDAKNIKDDMDYSFNCPPWVHTI